jgi:hypothetical protein
MTSVSDWLAKAHTLAFEFRAHLAEVVHLTVVDDPVPDGWILHGLMAEQGHIQDGETTASKPQFEWLRMRFPQNRRAVIVRSPVRKRLRGPFQQFL